MDNDWSLSPPFYNPTYLASPLLTITQSEPYSRGLSITLIFSKRHLFFRTRSISSSVLNCALYQCNMLLHAIAFFQHRTLHSVVLNCLFLNLLTLFVDVTRYFALNPCYWAQLVNNSRYLNHRIKKEEDKNDAVLKQLAVRFSYPLSPVFSLLLLSLLLRPYQQRCSSSLSLSVLNSGRIKNSELGTLQI